MVNTLVLVEILSLVASGISAPTDTTISIMLSDETAQIFPLTIDEYASFPYGQKQSARLNCVNRRVHLKLNQINTQSYNSCFNVNVIQPGEKVECSAFEPLTYAFTWNDVLKGPIKESCAQQLAAQRDGTWNLDDCLEEASLMLNPAIVESLNFALMPRHVAAGGAACAAMKSAAGTATASTTSSRTNVTMGNAINAPLATIAPGRLVCRQVAFDALLQAERTLERLISVDYSLVAVVKFRAEAAPLLNGAQPDRLSPFLALVGRKLPTDYSEDSVCGLRVATQLLRRQHRRGLFF